MPRDHYLRARENNAAYRARAPEPYGRPDGSRLFAAAARLRCPGWEFSLRHEAGSWDLMGFLPGPSGELAMTRPLALASDAGDDDVEGAARSLVESAGLDPDAAGFRVAGPGEL